MAALRLLREAEQAGDPFRVALLDMLLPGMGGIDLAYQVKADPRLNAMQLILVTSLGQRGESDQVNAAGFSGYLMKPLRQAQLYECLAMALGQPGIMPAQPGRVAEGSKCKVHILLVEDNPVNQLVVSKILAKLGYRAEVVGNGHEAIAALQVINYDLVLMDCQMPEMDGFEATRCIRGPQSTALNPAVPIIALTAHALKGDREMCLAAGMDDYLSKPVQVNELVAVLDTWLVAPKQKSAFQPQKDMKQVDKAAETSATKAADDTGVFNQLELYKRMLSDPELEKRVVTVFLEEMPQRISALKQSLENRDFTNAYRQAHTIKGAAANLSASRLRQAAYELEKADLENPAESGETKFSQLEVEFQRLVATLKKIYFT